MVARFSPSQSAETLARMIPVPRNRARPSKTKTAATGPLPIISSSQKGWNPSSFLKKHEGNFIGHLPTSQHPKTKAEWSILASLAAQLVVAANASNSLAKEQKKRLIDWEAISRYGKITPADFKLPGGLAINFRASELVSDISRFLWKDEFYDDIADYLFRPPLTLMLEDSGALQLDKEDAMGRIKADVHQAFLYETAKDLDSWQALWLERGSRKIFSEFKEWLIGSGRHRVVDMNLVGRFGYDPRDPDMATVVIDLYRKSIPHAWREAMDFGELLRVSGIAEKLFAMGIRFVPEAMTVVDAMAPLRNRRMNKSRAINSKREGATLDLMPALESAYRGLSGHNMPAWLAADLGVRLRNQKTGMSGEQVRLYADAMAAAEKYSDLVLHRKFQLGNHVGTLTEAALKAISASPESSLFDALELARCVARLATDFDGVRHNILSAIHADQEAQTDNPYLAPVQREALGVFADASACFLAMKVAESKHASVLIKLKEHLADQEAFGNRALAFATSAGESLGAPISSATENPLIALVKSRTESHFLLSQFRRLYLGNAPLRSIAGLEADPDGGQDDDDTEPTEAEPVTTLTQTSPMLTRGMQGMFSGRALVEGDFSLVESMKQTGEVSHTVVRIIDPMALLRSKRENVGMDAEHKLLKKRDQLRKQLDDLESAADISQGQILRQLAKLRFSERETASQAPEEEGLLNSRRFAQLIADPSTTDIYMGTMPQPYSDVAVTFLIDNSGSMSGKFLQVATACADTMAGALERLGTRTEIFGFTGDKFKVKDLPNSFRRRLPRTPDRAGNEAEVVGALLVKYKDHSRGWKAARQNMGIALGEEFLNSTPEGMALDEAWRSIRRRPEKKKIILVISDGNPNDLDYLNSTIEAIEMEGQVHLVAIIVGHGVSGDYRIRTVVETLGGLRDGLNRQLIAQLKAPLPGGGVARRVRRRR